MIMKKCSRMKGETVALAVFLLSQMLVSSQSFAFPAQIAHAPENTLDLTLTAIRSAKKSLLINAYELYSPEIVSAIQSQIRDGISVQILQEGQPVGGMSDLGRQVQEQLVSAMENAGNGDQYFEMRKGPDGQKRRFHFNHAKYIVVDDESLLLGSENYSPTGNPAAGSVGNRGWEVFLHQPETAHSFTQLFIEDTNLSYGDVAVLKSGLISGDSPSKGGGAGNNFCELFPFLCFTTEGSKVSSNDTPMQDPVETVEVSALQRITSPDTSLSGLVGMIQGAQKTLDIEDMTFYSTWGATSNSTLEIEILALTQSPLIEAIQAAAVRGVRVRVLLNDENAFASGNGGLSDGFDMTDSQTRLNHNLATVNLLNDFARSKGVALTARIANLKGMGVKIIHNKGALVDDDRVLISSINWNQNSVLNNREAAVLLTSPQARKSYGALFDKDWQLSQ